MKKFFFLLAAVGWTLNAAIHILALFGFDSLSNPNAFHAFLIFDSVAIFLGVVAVRNIYRNILPSYQTGGLFAYTPAWLKRTTIIGGLYGVIVLILFLTKALPKLYPAHIAGILTFTAFWTACAGLFMSQLFPIAWPSRWRY